jgi:hypothetical protein
LSRFGYLSPYLCAAALCALPRLAFAATATQGDYEDLVVPARPASPAQAPAQPAAPPAAAPTPQPAAAGAVAPPAQDDAAQRLAAALAPYTVTGYVQGDFQTNQTSEDQLGQGGVPLNKDRFLLRRARVRVDGEYKYAALQLEVDGNTIRGPQMRVQHAFGTIKLPGKEPSLPIAAATVGLFDAPFGYELVEWPRARWFLERTTASQAFFPSEPDLGVRLHGNLAFVRWDVAAMNGEPIDERVGFPGLTPRAAKDVYFRVGVETKPRDDLAASGHVSALTGRGFHPGTDATKATIQWKDQNEDGAIQPVELSGVPAVAATPSQTYERWAVGADAQARLTTRLGTSMLYGEVVVAKNLDRGLFVADPIVTGIDSRELGFYVGFVQEITRFTAVGFRWDRYDPNADFFDKRGGKLIPTSQAIDSFSPLAALRLPDPSIGDRARLLFEYDIVKNNLARDARGLPTNLASNVLTLRLQVSL